MPATYAPIPSGDGWSVGYAADHSRQVFAGTMTIGSMTENTARLLADYLNSAHAAGFIAGARYVQTTVHKALYQAGGGLDLSELHH